MQDITRLEILVAVKMLIVVTCNNPPSSELNPGDGSSAFLPNICNNHMQDNVIILKTTVNVQDIMYICFPYFHDVKTFSGACQEHSSSSKCVLHFVV